MSVINSLRTDRQRRADRIKKILRRENIPYEQFNGAARFVIDLPNLPKIEYFPYSDKWLKSGEMLQDIDLLEYYLLEHREYAAYLSKSA